MDEERENIIEQQDDSSSSDDGENNSDDIESGNENDSAEIQQDVEDEMEGLLAEQQADEELLQNLENAVTENPYDYQSHVSLIDALRNSGELDRLRSARDRFAGAFPLTPKLWLQWISDERRIDTEWARIRQLFERAVRDYLSVELWLEYVQAACGKLPPPELRDLCERALTECGLHVADGRLLWDAYRLYETALAEASAAVQQQQGQDDSSTTKPKNMDLVLLIFKRQLSLPLIGLEETKEEFIATFGEEKFDDSSIRQLYEKAREELRSLEAFETGLQRANGDTDLDTYLRYLDYEECIGGEHEEQKEKSAKSTRSPNVARVRCLYERALASDGHCLNVDLWSRYTGWLDKRFSSSGASILDTVLPVYERAVRNCPWSAPLWIKYALACERSCMENWCAKAEAVFDRAINEGAYNTAGEAAELWLARAYQKRRAAQAGLATKYEDVVEECFENGSKFLKEKFGVTWDPSCSYRRSWANYLVAAAKPDGTMLEKCRGIWKDILGSEGNSRLASVWLEYFNQVERRFVVGGEPTTSAEARKTLYRALNAVTDFPDYVAHALRQFELEYGTLADLDEAEERIRKMTAKFEARKKQQHALTSTGGGKQYHQQHQHQPKSQSQSKSPPKKVAVPVTVKETTTTTESRKRKKEQVPEEAEEQQQQPKPKQSKLNGDPDKPKPDPSLSTADRARRTVFVSNLSFALTEDQLREVFQVQQIGPVAEVRLKKQPYSGRSKGYGWVEFQTEDSVRKALALDRHPIQGRPMYVSEFKERKPEDEAEITKTTNKSDGQQKSAAADKYHFDAGLEKNKLFVRNIPKHATEPDLRGIFEPHGSLKSVRLVTFPSGQSKGIAYVEFVDEQSASAALAATDGTTVLFGKPLSVQLSNPPPRRSAAAADRPFSSGRQQMMPPPPALGMLPRSLAAPAAAGERKKKLDLG